MRGGSSGCAFLHLSLTILLILHTALPRCLSSQSENVHYTSVAEAPSPQMMPFTNNTVPILSGQCGFNFSSVERLLQVTATDCWSSLAPYLANAVCCPQYEAILTVLLGQTGMLALNGTQADHCISDVGKILESRGANSNLQKICSMAPNNLTTASCPVTDAEEADRILTSSGLLASCHHIDVSEECCKRSCQNAISDAAEKLALGNHSAVLGDCTNIVLRWLARKLDPSLANRILRGISSCTISEACPLAFPEIGQVSEECGIQMKNHTSCCNAMRSYMSDLQNQSFITDSQALNCASLLSVKLQGANITRNIYDQCKIQLKDFSIQAPLPGNGESGCILPSLPLDVTFNESLGIGFNCNLKDNVVALWHSNHSVYTSSCNKSSPSVTIPELPKVSASTQNDASITISASFDLMLAALLSISIII